MGYQPREPMSINRSRTPPLQRTVQKMPASHIGIIDEELNCCRGCIWSVYNKPAWHNLACRNCENRKYAERSRKQTKKMQKTLERQGWKKVPYCDTADVTFEVSDIEVEWIVVKENEHEQ